LRRPFAITIIVPDIKRGIIQLNLISLFVTRGIKMNIKHLKEKLNQFPDDMEVLIGDCDWLENEFNISKIEINHCNYTNK
jgi:hypothetical protein